MSIWNDITERLTGRMLRQKALQSILIEAAHREDPESESATVKGTCGHWSHIDEVDPKTGMCVNCHDKAISPDTAPEEDNTMNN